MRLVPPCNDQHTDLNGSCFAQDAVCHTHIVVLPGNPGVIEFYRRWLLELANRLPHDVRQRVTVHGLGLPGHDLRCLNGSRTFGIEDHRRYVESYLSSTNVLPSAATSQVVFVGHSYGAHLILRLLSEKPHLIKRSHLIMLMPAVHQMSACMPSFIHFITNQSVANILVPVVSALTSISPSSWRKSLVQSLLYDACSESVLFQMTAAHKRQQLFHNCVALANDEKKSILHPRQQAASALLGPSRSFLLWTDNDCWCTEENVDAIRSAFGNLTVKLIGFESPVKHAFMLHSTEMQRVASVVASWLLEILRQD